MHDSELSPGAVAACGRLEAFFRLADPETGRWLLEMAERLAAASCRRRTLEPAGRRAKSARRGQ